MAFTPPTSNSALKPSPGIVYDDPQTKNAGNQLHGAFPGRRYGHTVGGNWAVMGRACHRTLVFFNHHLSLFRTISVYNNSPRVKRGENYCAWLVFTHPFEHALLVGHTDRWQPIDTAVTNKPGEHRLNHGSNNGSCAVDLQQVFAHPHILYVKGPLIVHARGNVGGRVATLAVVPGMECGQKMTKDFRNNPTSQIILGSQRRPLRTASNCQA